MEPCAPSLHTNQIMKRHIRKISRDDHTHFGNNLKRNSKKNDLLIKFLKVLYSKNSIRRKNFDLSYLFIDKF